MRWSGSRSPCYGAIAGGQPPGDDGTRFELGLDGRAIADCDPHGRWLRRRAGVSAAEPGAAASARR